MTFEEEFRKSGVARVSGGSACFLKRTWEDSYAGVHESAHLREEPSEAYIKEGRGSGSDLAVTKHDVRPPFIVPPLGLRFVTPQSPSTPIQAGYSHFKSLAAVGPVCDGILCDAEHISRQEVGRQLSSQSSHWNLEVSAPVPVEHRDMQGSHVQQRILHLELELFKHMCYY